MFYVFKVQCFARFARKVQCFARFASKVLRVQGFFEQADAKRSARSPNPRQILKGSVQRQKDAQTGQKEAPLKDYTTETHRKGHLD